jgi:stage II sporulation protein D
VRPILTVPFAALVTGLVVGVLPAAPAQAEEISIPTGDGHLVRIDGRGYGHGNGMSQWGAQGAARQGVGYRKIVEFYYPGTSWGRAGGPIAVRITADTSPDVVVVRRKGLRVARVGGDAMTLPAKDTSRWRLLPDGGDTRVQWLAGSRWRTWQRLEGAAEIWARRGTTLVTPSGQRTYRGRLRAVGGLSVNVLSLEHYLRGVVPQEVPALWEPDAVRAQAVAARTYAAFERDSRAGSWDVYDTTASQVYGGKGAEHPAATDAIRHTAGEVLLHDGAPAFTQFSASSGGWTSAGSRPYLVSKSDPWDTWSGNPHSSWTVDTRDGTLEAKYPAVGELRSIRVGRAGRRYARGGRAVKVVLEGTRGSVTVSGDSLRWALGLKSTWFRLSRG